jgi:hypothetical protein
MSRPSGTTIGRARTITPNFESAMRNVFGKRLTYNQLTGAGSATSH